MRAVIHDVTVTVTCLLLAACGDDLWVKEVKLPDGEGVVTPDSPRINRGALDVYLRTSYVAELDVVNDGSALRVGGAVVELHLDSPEGPLIDIGGGQTVFTTYSAGFVPAGEGVVGFEVIPPALGVALHDQLAASAVPSLTILAIIRVFGAGDRKSATFFWPVDVSFGGLVTYPPEADDVQNRLGACDSEEVPAPVFRVGQDEAVDCRFCRSNMDAICHY